MKKLLGYFLLLTTYNIIQSNCCSISKNTWLPRAFSSYLSRDLLYNKPFLKPKPPKYILACQNICNNISCFANEYPEVTDPFYEKTAGYFHVVAEYMQSFGQDCNGCNNLGAMPFWSGTNTLTVGNNDGKAHLDGYQFGLGNIQKDLNGNTIIGAIQLNPTIQHVGADILLYYKKSYFDPGWYFKIKAPLGAMIIHPNLKETQPIFPTNELSFHQTTQNPNSSEITYQWDRYPTPKHRHHSLVHAFLGGSSDEKILDGNTIKEPRLRKGRIGYYKQEVIRLGDLSTSLGYNVIADEKGFLGFGFKVSCPTGNVPTADYMLEPIFGRAGLWAVGAEAISHWKIWQDEKNNHLDIAGQAEILHLMPGRKNNFRSFDLKQNGPGSKYLLIQEYIPIYNKTNSAGDPPLTTSETTIPDYIQQAVNLTTLPIISHINVEGTCALMLKFYHDNWDFGLGGEIWGRSHEHLKIDTRSAIDLRLPNLNDFAVVGRQVPTYYIDGQTSPVQTFYCEPLARINKSQDPVILVGTVMTVSASTEVPKGIKDGRLAQNRIPANLNDALDICGAEASSVVTGKLFGQFGYSFKQRAYKPSLALMWGVEFNGTNNAIQLWSVALKGSLSF